MPPLGKLFISPNNSFQLAPLPQSRSPFVFYQLLVASSRVEPPHKFCYILRLYFQNPSFRLKTPMSPFPHKLNCCVIYLPLYGALVSLVTVVLLLLLHNNYITSISNILHFLPLCFGILRTPCMLTLFTLWIILFVMRDYNKTGQFGLRATA